MAATAATFGVRAGNPHVAFQRGTIAAAQQPVRDTSLRRREPVESRQRTGGEGIQG